MNKLSEEKSPYLLQHADNPVHWFAWGEEAFEKARSEDKAIFLSIGYSTCHWCHVMEEESFENEKIAQFLNEHFIAIKVDREERPDIDAHYMKAVQAMTGGGGWPLNVFLTPDGVPFYGGTYFPPEDKWGRLGLISILQSIAATWKDERSKIKDSAQKMLALFLASDNKKTETVTEINEKDFDIAFQKLVIGFDKKYGGIGYAPKFPMPHVYSFLLRYYDRTKNQQALEMVKKTVQAIGMGGIYDQLNGGVHRYSVDLYWRVPHFEKMLYDQALMARLFVETYQVTDDLFFKEKGEGILDFVAASMRGTHGAFYSAIDADSFTSHTDDAEKKEGAYYMWSLSEIKTLLEEEQKIFTYRYGITEDGNTLSDPHNEFVNANVLFEANTLADVAKKFKKEENEILSILDDCHKTLIAEQQKRPFPHVDDKVLTDWNGLMIASYAYSARVFDDAKYLEIAEKAAQFILNTMRTENGHLMHRYREGDIKINGFLDDYAFFAYGLIELFYATQDTSYLQHAQKIADVMIDLFYDEENGGFSFSCAEALGVIVPQKDFYDGAIPSGNSIATITLLQLTHLTGNKTYQKHAEKTLSLMAAKMKEQPLSYSQSLIAADYAIGPLTEVTIISVPDDTEKAHQLQVAFNSSFLPRGLLSVRNHSDAMDLIPPFARNYTLKEDKSTAFICSGFACFEPTQSVEELKECILSK